MRYINRRFTYLLTCASHQRIYCKLTPPRAPRLFMTASLERVWKEQSRLSLEITKHPRLYQSLVQSCTATRRWNMVTLLAAADTKQPDKRFAWNVSSTALEFADRGRSVTTYAHILASSLGQVSSWLNVEIRSREMTMFLLSTRHPLASCVNASLCRFQNGVERCGPRQPCSRLLTVQVRTSPAELRTRAFWRGRHRTGTKLRHVHLIAFFSNYSDITCNLLLCHYFILCVL